MKADDRVINISIYNKYIYIYIYMFQYLRGGISCTGGSDSMY